MRLRSATRCRDEANRARAARRPLVPGPGGTRHRDREQGRRLPPPGPRSRHGRREPSPRLPGGSSELQVCRLHAPGPRGDVDPAHDEQPRENRGAPRVRCPRDETHPAPGARHGDERSLPAIEEGAPPASAHDADGPPSSIDATTRSAVIVSPSATATRRTTPSPGAGISFCIFIASKITSVWPRWTRVPAPTATRTTRPGIDERTSTTAPWPAGRPSTATPLSSEMSTIRRRWTWSLRITWFPWIRRRYRFAPIRTSTASAAGRARARYVAPSILMTKPSPIASTSISRRSPSTSRRNRMATSRKPFPPPRQRPPRDRGPFERECRAAGQLTARDEGCGNRREAFLPWAATPKAGRDPQVRDHRRPQVPADELSPLEKLAVERKGRQHSSNLVGLDASPHSFDRLPPIPTPDDQLRNQWVIVRWDDRACRDAAIDPDARAGRFAVANHATGRRKEIADRIFGVDAAFNRVPMAGEFRLGDLEAIPRRDPDLLSHQVHPGHHFRDWILHLEPGVDLVEREAAVVQQELDRAGIAIPKAAESPHRGVDQAGTEASSHGGRGRLLDELLMTTLDAALPLDEPYAAP